MREVPGLRPATARAYILAADPELKQALANVPLDSLAHTETERQNFARLVNASPTKSYTAGPGPEDAWHRILPQLNEDEVTSLVARGKFDRGVVAEWVFAVKGHKPTGLSVAESQRWDREVQDRVDAIMANAHMLNVKERGKT